MSSHSSSEYPMFYPPSRPSTRGSLSAELPDFYQGPYTFNRVDMSAVNEDSNWNFSPDSELYSERRDQWYGGDDSARSPTPQSYAEGGRVFYPPTISTDSHWEGSLHPSQVSELDESSGSSPRHTVNVPTTSGITHDSHTRSGSTLNTNQDEFHIPRKPLQKNHRAILPTATSIRESRYPVSRGRYTNYSLPSGVNRIAERDAGALTVEASSNENDALRALSFGEPSSMANDSEDSSSLWLQSLDPQQAEYAVRYRGGRQVVNEPQLDPSQAEYYLQSNRYR
ncbi:hypothetical protein IAR55_005335 [Kwoniella newhampshirensis]|uniref:Uncharacterized protein n=1 Tax=Kwoniella newhampshirensis TaxID=1651941 RepID=A0AAW0YVB9_9TREE